MNKLNLYFDYLKRFDAAQLIHLLKSRSKIRLFTQAMNKPLKSSDRTDSTSPEDFLNRYRLLFTAKDGQSVIIDEISENGLLNEHYFTILQKRLIESMENKTLSESIWLTYDSSDSEIQNNFFRFHLFSEAAASVNMTNLLRKQLILKWLSIEAQDQIDQNSFNCALRLLNWFKLISKLEPADFSSQEWNEIKNSIFKYILFVNRNIEHHIPGNHVFIQQFIIWLAAALFPKWIHSLEILNSSTVQLTAEVEKQFLKSSGLHFELCTHYHVQILQFLLLWINASRRIDRIVPSCVESTAKNALQSFNHLCFSDEYMPIIGDNCYPFIHSSFRSDIKNIITLSSSLFSDNFVPQNDQNYSIIDIDQQYLVSNIKHSKLILDVGELGYSPNPGHGHSDLMSIVYFDKIPVLIDAGTRRYTNNPEDLRLKRSSSHNTISINDKDYGILWGFFRWSFLPKRPIYATKTNTDGGNILDVRYEWLKILPGITQKRKISHTEFAVEIIDLIEGENRADVISSFILHQNIKSELFDNLIKLSSAENSWSISVESNSEFVLNIQPFTIYSQYNVPLESNQIKIECKQTRLPIEIKFKISRINGW